ncbi:hypothetical protein BDZ94DRAFT_1249571 [Collybia nuda]|uniref:Uncharacterized protein n=1 Tax=Collybia nuda TaxID=64659 RepID=A0A9P6CNL4_9AGAR|nr:hypothetical protein BDZ94DRAFT_1249571 [Collybia nuda]
MDSIISLHNICNAAITTIDDARMIVRQADDAKASHVIQETALVEEVQRLLQERRKTESDAEHTRTPTPLSEIDANPGPEPPQRRQREPPVFLPRE